MSSSGSTADYRRAVRAASARELALLAESIEFLVEMATPVPAAAAVLISLRDAVRDAGPQRQD